MANYKRVSQLQETQTFLEGDYLPIDRDTDTETKKINLKNLFSDLLTRPEIEEAEPTQTWARQGGTWVRIYPDRYIEEANIDGIIYGRKNGRWVPIEGSAVSDMMSIVYDERKTENDIYSFVQNLRNSPGDFYRLVAGGYLALGNYLNIPYFKEGINNFYYSDSGNKDNKKVKTIQIFQSQNDIFNEKNFSVGSYDAPGEEKIILRTSSCIPVKKGQTLYLKNLSGYSIQLNFIETDQTNKKIGSLEVQSGVVKKNFIIFNDAAQITFLKDCFLGLEYKINESDEEIISTFIQNNESSFERYKLGLLGSLSASPSVQEIQVNYPSSQEYPLRVDLKENRIIKTLTSKTYAKQDWAFDSITSNYVKAYAEIPNSNVTFVYADGYRFVKAFDDIDDKQITVIESGSQKRIGIKTYYTEESNSDFSLEVFYNNEETSEDFSPLTFSQGQNQFFGTTIYEDGSFSIGNFVYEVKSLVEQIYQLASTDVPGIVQDSEDVTYQKGKATVIQAGKIKNLLTLVMGETRESFDGSAEKEIEITPKKIGTLTEEEINQKISEATPQWSAIDGGEY